MSTSAPADDTDAADSAAAAQAQALAHSGALAAAAPSIPQESADSAWMALWGARVGDSMLFTAPVQCVCAQCRLPAEHAEHAEHNEPTASAEHAESAPAPAPAPAPASAACTSNPLVYDPELPTLSTGGRYFAFRRGPCVQCLRLGRGAQCSASTANSGQVWVFDTLAARWETHLVHGLWYSRKAGVRGRRVRRPVTFCCELARAPAELTDRNDVDEGTGGC